MCKIRAFHDKSISSRLFTWVICFSYQEPLNVLLIPMREKAMSTLHLLHVSRNYRNYHKMFLTCSEPDLFPNFIESLHVSSSIESLASIIGLLPNLIPANTMEGTLVRRRSIVIRHQLRQHYHRLRSLFTIQDCKSREMRKRQKS